MRRIEDMTQLLIYCCYLLLLPLVAAGTAFDSHLSVCKEENS